MRSVLAAPVVGEAGRWSFAFSALSKRSVPKDRWCCVARSGAACSRSCWCTAARCCRPIVSSTRWPTARRAAARPGTVQTYLSQLRKVLPQIGAELITQPSGYVLELQDDTLDAARFESMVRAAASEPDRGSRLRLLDGALGLWRGAALEEFSWPWAVAERARLDRRRLDALVQPRRGTARARRVPRSAQRARRAHRRVSARRAAVRATHAGGVPRRPPGRGPPRVPAAAAQPRAASSGSSPDRSSSSSSVGCSTTIPRCAPVPRRACAGPTRLEPPAGCRSRS